MSVTSSPATPVKRLERILAYMIAGIVGLSLIAFVIVMIATAAGVGRSDEFSQGIWPFVFMLPLFGLPIGFILLIVLLIVSTIRRRREAN